MAESFSRFTLIEKLATGGMAEVYLARATGAEGMDKYFALKRILPQHMKDKEFLEMFKSEAKIALNLTQSNIAQILEFGLEGEQFFLLMEFIDGRDLRQILNRCAELQDGFTIDQAIYIISELAAGLDYAHRCVDKKTGRPLKLIHRDISPQNIMISFDGEVKIIDFGIAKAENRASHTKAGTVKGKLSYMSPQQALGETLDSRTDIFSGGIILWELMTGRRLFDHDDDMVTIQKIRECRIPDPRIYNSGIPDDLQRIIMRALSRDLNFRYQSAKEFQRDLITFLHKVNPKFTPDDLAVTLRKLFHSEIEEFRTRIQNAVVAPQGQTMMAASTSKDLENISQNNPYFGEPTKSKNIKMTPIPEVLNKELIAEAPVGLKIHTPSPQEDSPPTWDTKKLMDGVKVKPKTHTKQEPAQAPARMTQSTESTKDSAIMIRAVLAFLFVSVGIYFREGVMTILHEKSEAVRTIVVSLQDQVENTLGLQRKSASVSLHEDGTTQNSSSVTATLQNAKVAIRVVPEASIIELNGHSYGNAPADLLIPLNTHVTITLKHDGYASFKQDFTVSGPKEINVTLQKQE